MVSSVIFSMKVLLTICVISTCSFVANTARILGVFPAPSYSHYTLASTLMKGLVANGHDVTVINPYPQKQPLHNYKDIELSGLAKAFREERSNPFEEVEINTFQFEISFNSFATDITEKVFKKETVQQLLKSNETFDLVIVEEFMSYALKGFCYHFNTPCVVFTPIGPFRIINSQVGNPISPSYITDFSLNYGSHMNFFERAHNAFAYLFGEYYKHVYVFPEHNRIIQKYLPGAPDINDLYYNVSLAIVNSHVSNHPAVPYVPNMIDIGGFHVQPAKQLPKDLKEYLDSAKEGAIFFSMGSNLRSIEFPPEKRESILRAFAKLKQRVLWKWEGENLPGKSPNVKIGKWLPQSDILAHPNVKLFITHCGLLSTIEAVYRGVPIVGIPIYGDQQMNIANAVSNGMGLKVPYTTLTEETLFSAIQEVLTNPRFQENAKIRSRIMQDQPVKPLEKAIFWIEYVIRHQGGPHLRTAALNLSWYQYLLLDVALFLFTVTLTGLTVLYFLIKLLFKKHPLKITNAKKTN